MLQWGNFAGFWALLGIPLVIFLHYFRRQRRQIPMTGLHLWNFARRQLPTGNRFLQLEKNLPLLLQILLVILISLLLADPRLTAMTMRPHHVILLDDSISMNAEGKSAPFTRKALQAIQAILDGDGTYTLIRVGKKPSISAGPKADAEEIQDRMNLWIPESSTCDLESALKFVSEMGISDRKPVFVTDHPDTFTAFSNQVYLCGIGEVVENCAFVYADRCSVDHSSDKLVLKIRNFGTLPVEKKIIFLAGKKEFDRKKVRIDPGQDQSLELLMNEQLLPVEVRLESDAFMNDNHVILPASVPRTVTYAFEGLGNREKYFQAAMNAIPYTKKSENLNTDMLFYRGPLPEGTRSMREYGFSEILTQEKCSFTSNQILVERNHRMMHNLYLDGVSWGFVQGRKMEGTPLIRFGIQPLFCIVPMGDTRLKGTFNLDIDRTTIFQHPAWPVLLMNLTEECRDQLESISKRNFRRGELVELSLDPSLSGKWELQIAGKAVRKWEFPPSVIENLKPDYYTLCYHQNPVVSFAVNDLLETESDFLKAATLKLDSRLIESESLQNQQENHVLFYLLCLLLILITGALWKYQDSSL